MWLKLADLRLLCIFGEPQNPINSVHYMSFSHFFPYGSKLAIFQSLHQTGSLILFCFVVSCIILRGEGQSYVTDFRTNCSSSSTPAETWQLPTRLQTFVTSQRQTVQCPCPLRPVGSRESHLSNWDQKWNLVLGRYPWPMENQAQKIKKEVCRLCNAVAFDPGAQVSQCCSFYFDLPVSAELVCV